MLIHLKAVRVFVESVLRYGLPANGADRKFSVCLINMDRRHESKAMSLLNAEFAQSADMGMDMGGDMGGMPGMDLGGFGGGSESFLPYVFFTVDVGEGGRS